MQRPFRTTLTVIAIAAAGMLIGGFVERIIHWPDKRDFALVRVAWAVDFNNRLSMLRLLRQYSAPEDTVRSIELSATTLLDTIDVEQIRPTDESYSVVDRAVKNLRMYRRDFPNSEFDPATHPSIRSAFEKFHDGRDSR
jgi:hypothetical protein